MAKPLAPGLVSRPNGKRANKLYWDGEDWHTASPPAPSARRKKPRIWPWVLGIVLVLFLTGRCSDSGHQGSQTSPSASPSAKLRCSSGRRGTDHVNGVRLVGTMWAEPSRMRANHLTPNTER